MAATDMNVEALRQHLTTYNQQHLIKFWDELSDSERHTFYQELTALDLDYVTQCFKQCQEDLSQAEQSIDDLLEPLPDNDVGSVVRTDAHTLKHYQHLGLSQIGSGKVAVLLLAGGQGTRLGTTSPKGMFNVGLPSQKTLYQLQAERIVKIQQLATGLTGKTAVVPWYIMTSDATTQPTEQFFASNNYFGLNPADIMFFEQNTMPCVDMDGRIIMDTRCSIARAPDGNGGLYGALNQSKMLDDLISRGIEYLHVYCVDNILVKMVDPVFIGFCISKNASCGVKVVEKTQPTEAVGVICRLSRKYHVVEYSEISPKTAEKRNEATGKLVFNAGGIANHFFTVDFMKHIVREKEHLLHHHIAKKKIPFCGDNGQQVTPSHINGIKMEKFIFDIFQFAQSLAVWEVLREDEFSPLKNAEGAARDTPTTCRQDLIDLHRRWAIKAGATLVSEDGATISHIKNYHGDYKDRPIIFEISPLVSYAGEGLEKLNGETIRLPRVLSATSEPAVTFK